MRSMTQPNRDTSTSQTWNAGAPSSSRLMRPISECKDGLAFCLACVERQVGLREQVALLLADVYGMSDQESAGHMEMSLSGFEGLLDHTRNRMNQHAGSRCALVGTSPSSAPAGTPEADFVRAAPSPISGRGPDQSIRWQVDDDKMRALRRELLKGLDL